MQPPMRQGLAGNFGPALRSACRSLGLGLPHSTLWAERASLNRACDLHSALHCA